MSIKDLKEKVRRMIGKNVGMDTRLTHDFIRTRAQDVFDLMAKEEQIFVDADERESVISSLCDDFLGFGPLEKLMKDPAVTEIMVNGPFKVFIEKNGKKLASNVKFDDILHLRYIVEKMLAKTGRRIDESCPFVDFSLDDGSRVNVVIPPVAVKEPIVTIRKFMRAIEKIEDLVKLDTLDQRMAQFLVACTRGKMNILFAGATGSGKTTTLEVLTSYIIDERIVVLEDTLELMLGQEHVVRLLTKPSNIEGKGEITMRDVFRNTLRMRPSRIILGEIRGAEAMDYIQALNSGHRGCLAVLHSASPIDTVIRLETMALYAGLNIPPWAVREQISSGLDIIVQQEQLLDGSRKITYITEVGDINEGKIELRDIFRYEIESVSDQGKVKGSFKTINTPKILTLLEKKGIHLDASIFTEK